jgi:hypothetical protein
MEQPPMEPKSERRKIDEIVLNDQRKEDRRSETNTRRSVSNDNEYVIDDRNPKVSDRRGHPLHMPSMSSDVERLRKEIIAQGELNRLREENPELYKISQEKVETRQKAILRPKITSSPTPKLEIFPKAKPAEPKPPVKKGHGLDNFTIIPG